MASRESFVANRECVNPPNPVRSEGAGEILNGDALPNQMPTGASQIADGAADIAPAFRLRVLEHRFPFGASRGEAGCRGFYGP